MSALILSVILWLASELDENWKTTINERLHILNTGYFLDHEYHE